MEATLVKQIIVEDQPFTIKEYFTSTFPKDVTPSQSLGIVVKDKKELVLISTDNSIWTPPGGKLEGDETPIEALIREVYEEAAVKIDTNSIKPLYYTEVYKGENVEYLTTQFRFLCEVQEINDFVNDPGGNVAYRKFVPFTEIDKFLLWDKTAEFIKDYLIKHYK